MNGKTGAAAIAAACVLVTILGGCARTATPPATTQNAAPAATSGTEGLSDQKAAEIVARFAGVDASKVGVLQTQVAGDLAEISAEAPGPGGAPEHVSVAYDQKRALLVHLGWPARLVFAGERTITRAEAEATAGELRKRWFPDVPVRMVQQPTLELHRPVYAVLWVGEADAGRLGTVRSGDRCAVQISSITGLPISYDQEVARRRVDPATITVTSAQAIEVARASLTARGEKSAAAGKLTAELLLSSPMNPDGGPVWVVRGPQKASGEETVVAVDAITAEEITANSLVDGGSEPRGGGGQSQGSSAGQ